jgi:hypothetical protein
MRDGYTGRAKQSGAGGQRRGVVVVDVRCKLRE